jgi:hypothetical protein
LFPLVGLRRGRSPLLIILLYLLRTLSLLSRLVITSYSSPVLSIVVNSLYRLFLRKLRTHVSAVAASRRRVSEEAADLC